MRSVFYDITLRNIMVAAHLSSKEADLAFAGVQSVAVNQANPWIDTG